MHDETNPANHRHCGAHCRTTGKPCKNAPVTGSVRCRMHGGKKSGRPVTTGQHTRQAIAQRRTVRALIRAVNELVNQANQASSR